MRVRREGRRLTSGGFFKSVKKIAVKQRERRSYHVNTFSARPRHRHPHSAGPSAPRGLHTLSVSVLRVLVTATLPVGSSTGFESDALAGPSSPETGGGNLEPGHPAAAGLWKGLRRGQRRPAWVLRGTAEPCPAAASVPASDRGAGGGGRGRGRLPAVKEHLCRPPSRPPPRELRVWQATPTAEGPASSPAAWVPRPSPTARRRPSAPWSWAFRSCLSEPEGRTPCRPPPGGRRAPCPAPLPACSRGHFLQQPRGPARLLLELPWHRRNPGQGPAEQTGGQTDRPGGTGASP